MPPSNNDETLSSSAAAMLCCDPSGQSIGVKGGIDPNQSGTYTSIMRIASQLDAFTSPSSSSSPIPLTSSPPTQAPSSSLSQPPQPTLSSLSSSAKPLSISPSSRPLISVETDCAITLIKAYGDHTVVTRLPTTPDASAVPVGSDGSKVSAAGIADPLVGNGSEALLESKSTKGEDSAVENAVDE
mmetsp:Transcript_6849/g.10414  ORF Transcript_6849/g.10414 Transcript_6849/m.10414 type:complete len:185 (+) Transcript_6849:50-604(+)